MTTVSAEAMNLIRFYEQGPKGGPALVAYRCPAGHWTIGYGHTGPEVVKGYTITAEQADRLLAKDVERFAKDVVFLTKGGKSVPTQAQFDALVCFAFNVGSDIDEDDIPEGLGDSTLLKKYLRGDIQGAADEFLKWNKGRVNGKKVVLPGLVKRRASERALFLTGRFQR